MSRTITRQGATAVGQRLRATTIHGRRFDGPDVSEWDDEDDDRPRLIDEAIHEGPFGPCGESTRAVS